MPKPLMPGRRNYFPRNKDSLEGLLTLRPVSVGCLLVEGTDKLVNTVGNRHSELGLGDFLLDNSID